MSDRKQLFTALALARGEVKPAPHDATNEWHDYPYTSAESVLAMTVPVLARHGVSVIPLTFEFRFVPGREDGAIHITSSWLLAHASGESLVMDREHTCKPEKGRPDDKALLSANTMILSYLLRDITGLPRPDAEAAGDDVSGRNDTASRPKPQAPRAGVARGARTADLVSPVPQSSPVRDVIVAINTVNGATWTRFDVMTGHGYRFGTFKATDAEAARTFVGSGQEMVIRWQKSSKSNGLDLVSVMPNDATTDPPATSISPTSTARGLAVRLRNQTGGSRPSAA